MKEKKYSVIGVMSGTSLDGIDLVLIEFKFESSWQFEIICSETIGYQDYWQNILKNLVSYSLLELHGIDENYTIYLAQIILNFIKKNNIEHIDAICSHGHTALHQPEKGLTYQIGNLPNLATILNQTVVCDFRVHDVTLGGQGAPLVPIGDKLLFSEYDFCLNLGGFANISTEKDGERIAYDICPVNIVLNYYVNKLGLNYDDKGKIALSGKVNNKLLDELNSLEFYKANYPKSLGFEWVNKTIFPLIDSYKLEIKDVLRTYVVHIVIQLAREINKKSNVVVLITGGGVYNSFLIDELEKRTNNKIVIPENNLVEFKEALIFGFLGVLKLRDEINTLKSVTGASKNHSSGKIFVP